MLILFKLWVVWLLGIELIGLSNWVTCMIGCISCYTKAYFPLFCCRDDCLLTKLLQSSLFGRWIFIHITGHSFDDLAKMSLQRSMTFRFWLSHYLWLLSKSLCWGSGSCPSRLFFLRLLNGLFFLDDDGFLQ